MGAAKVVPSERSKSHLSYYVAMAIIVGLLIILCCYACYFFLNKIRELSTSDLPSTTPSTSCPKKEPVSYPVQPVVRDSASAMAALCKQLPAGYTLQGGQVFPGGRSPDPRPALASPPPPPPPPATAPPPGTAHEPPGVDPVPDKVLDTAAAVPCITLEEVK